MIRPVTKPDAWEPKNLNGRECPSARQSCQAESAPTTGGGMTGSRRGIPGYPRTWCRLARIPSRLRPGAAMRRLEAAGARPDDRLAVASRRHWSAGRASALESTREGPCSGKTVFTSPVRSLRVMSTSNRSMNAIPASAAPWTVTGLARSRRSPAGAALIAPALHGLVGNADRSPDGSAEGSSQSGRFVFGEAPISRAAR